MRSNKILILLLSVFVFAFTSIAQPQQEIDGVIAVVGSSMIKYSDLETNYLQSRSSNPDITRDEVLENMLLNKLIFHQAEVDSIEVTEDEIDNELSSRIKYMIQVYGSQERLEKQMNKTMTEIRESFHDVIRDNLLIGQEQSKIVGEESVTPKEVADYFEKIPKDSLPNIEEQYTLSQIVILPKVSDADKEEVKKRLNDIRDRILKGAKFSTLASLYSDDEASARKGGELGFFSRGDMVGEFESVAFSLQLG